MWHISSVTAALECSTHLILPGAVIQSEHPRRKRRPLKGEEGYTLTKKIIIILIIIIILEGVYSLTNLVQAGQLAIIHVGLATSQLCIHMLYMWISNMQSRQEPFHLKRKHLKFQVSVPAQDSTHRIDLE